MLVEELNAKGGVDGRKIQLIVKDTGRRPGEGGLLREAADRGGSGLRHHRPGDQRRDDAGEGDRRGGEDDPHLLRRGRGDREPGRPHVFNVAPKDRYAAEMIFRQMKKMGIKKIGLLSSNTGFGKAGKEQVEKLAPGGRHRDRRQRGLRQGGHRPDRRGDQAEGGRRPGDPQLVDRAGPGDRHQERAADRAQDPDLPEPRLRQHPVREDGRRRGRGRDVPGEPHRRRRRAPREAPAEGGRHGVQEGLRGEVQGGRHHLRRPRVGLAPHPGPRGEGGGARP